MQLAVRSAAVPPAPEPAGAGEWYSLFTYGFAHRQIVAGDIAAARATFARARDGTADWPTIRVLRAGVALQLGALQLDDELVARFAADRIVEETLEAGPPEHAGFLVGALSSALADRAPVRLSALRSRAVRLLRGTAIAHALLDHVALHDGEPVVGLARALLERSAAAGEPLARAHLDLFIARRALRAGDRSGARAAATAAAGAFEALRRPFEQAQALEILGEDGPALAIYRRTGNLRDARRLARAQPPCTDGRAGLTRRERDVARLVARGLPNRAIADELSVSERTVTTHLSSIFARLGISSRTQLALAVVNT